MRTKNHAGHLLIDHVKTDPDNDVICDPGAGDGVGGQDRVRAQVQ